MKIYNSLSQLIGNTPLLRVSDLADNNCQIFAKLEYLNPCGSAKDRVAKNMIDAAIEQGKISKGSTIIEPTSGNTGIGIASYALQLGMKAVIVMPENMSDERKKLLAAYGAILELTPAEKGMTGSIERANELAKQIEGSFIPSQFENPDNWKAHYKTTGPEIWEDTDGKVDIFVACVGTGGTLTGVGKFLKEKNPHIKIVAVEPFDSPLLSKGVSGPHKIQGIGANFIPEVLDTNIYDEIICAKTEQAYDYIKKATDKFGLLVGISSGAALFAACETANREENREKNIVVLLPDAGERYLSVL